MNRADSRSLGISSHCSQILDLNLFIYLVVWLLVFQPLEKANKALARVTGISTDPYLQILDSEYKTMHNSCGTEPGNRSGREIGRSISSERVIDWRHSLPVVSILFGIRAADPDYIVTREANKQYSHPGHTRLTTEQEFSTSQNPWFLSPKSWSDTVPDLLADHN